MWKRISGGLAVVWLGVGCATTPYTNRTQLMLVSESQEAQLGVDVYRQVLGQSQLVTDPTAIEIVRRVGDRIARVASKPDYHWEFQVIDEPGTANAFALPGGKVAVYSGIFPVARDEAGLAAVMAHEVAHALARHGAERMSQSSAAQFGAAALSVALGGSNPQAAQAIMQAYGLGAQFGVLLPFSRGQESEADHIGMLLMAKAGYNPEAALGLWQRMEQLNPGGPPEYLSTHPSYSTRQQSIHGWLPEAQREFHIDPAVTNATLPDPVAVATGNRATTSSKPPRR